MSEEKVKDKNEEQEIWSGSPSQWLNFPKFVICVPLPIIFIIASDNIIGGLVTSLAPLLYMGWHYLVVMMWKIKITSERVIETKGVINLKTDELQIYRVKDLNLEQPIYLRLVGLSNINLVSSDKSDPNILIPTVPNGDELREEISQAVETMRRRKGVREFD